MSDYVRMPKADYQDIANNIRNILDISSSTKIKSGDIVPDLTRIYKKVPTNASILNVTGSGTYNFTDQDVATGNAIIKAGDNHHRIFLQQRSSSDITGTGTLYQYAVRVSEDPDILTTSSANITFSYINGNNTYTFKEKLVDVESATDCITWNTSNSNYDCLVNVDFIFVYRVPNNSSLIGKNPGFPSAGIYFATQLLFLGEITNISLDWDEDHFNSLDYGKYVGIIDNSYSLLNQGNIKLYYNGTYDTTAYNQVDVIVNTVEQVENKVVTTLFDDYTTSDIDAIAQSIDDQSVTAMLFADASVIGFGNVYINANPYQTSSSKIVFSGIANTDSYDIEGWIAASLTYKKETNTETGEQHWVFDELLELVQGQVVNLDQYASSIPCELNLFYHPLPLGE